MNHDCFLYINTSQIKSGNLQTVATLHDCQTPWLWSNTNQLISILAKNTFTFESYVPNFIIISHIVFILWLDLTFVFRPIASRSNISGEGCCHTSNCNIQMYVLRQIVMMRKFLSVENPYYSHCKRITDLQ